MSDPYVGEIRLFGGSFAPTGWAFCDGQLLAIAAYETLFQLIGTTYGGDGVTTYALPDLRGRLPLHQGTNGGTSFQLGESTGAEAVTLTVDQVPSHTHALLAADVQGTQVSPAGNLLARSFNVTPYLNDAPDGSMLAGAIEPRGGSQPHENRQPYLGVSFIIALDGIFPSPT